MLGSSVCPWMPTNQGDPSYLTAAGSRHSFIQQIFTAFQLWLYQCWDKTVNRTDKIPVLKGAYSPVGENETTISTYIRKVFPAE